MADYNRINSLLDDYEASQNPVVQATPVAAPENEGFVDGLVRSGKALGYGVYDAVTDQLPEDVARIARGGESLGQDSWMQRTIDQQQKDREAVAPHRQALTAGSELNRSLYEGPKSVATSVATGTAGMLAGSATGTLLAGPVGTMVGGVVGAGAGSGAAMYRQAKDQFKSQIYDVAKQSNPNMSDAEWAEIDKNIEDDAVKSGLWEAGPEFASQALTAGLMKGVGGKIFSKIPGFDNITKKIAGNTLARLGLKTVADVAGEEGTEYATYEGQAPIEKKYGLRDTDPSLGEFIREQAGPVAVGSLLGMGTMGMAEKMSESYKAKRKAHADSILKAAGLAQKEEWQKATAEADRIMGVMPPATTSDGGVSAAMDMMDAERAQAAPSGPTPSAFPSTMEGVNAAPDVAALNEQFPDVLNKTSQNGDIGSAMDAVEAERADPNSQFAVEAAYRKRREQAKILAAANKAVPPEDQQVQKITLEQRVTNLAEQIARLGDGPAKQVKIGQWEQAQSDLQEINELDELSKQYTAEGMADEVAQQGQAQQDQQAAIPEIAQPERTPESEALRKHFYAQEDYGPLAAQIGSTDPMAQETIPLPGEADLAGLDQQDVAETAQAEPEYDPVTGYQIPSASPLPATESDIAAAQEGNTFPTVGDALTEQQRKDNIEQQATYERASALDKDPLANFLKGRVSSDSIKQELGDQGWEDMSARFPRNFWRAKEKGHVSLDAAEQEAKSQGLLGQDQRLTDVLRDFKPASERANLASINAINRSDVMTATPTNALLTSENVPVIPDALGEGLQPTNSDGTLQDGTGPMYRKGETVESPPKFPRFKDDEGSTVSEDPLGDYLEQIKEWESGITTWAEKAPDVLQFGNDRGDLMDVVSKNTRKNEEPWRVTHFFKKDGNWIPSGHSTFSTKLKAVKEAAGGKDYRPDVHFRNGSAQQSPTVSHEAGKTALAATPYGANVIVLKSPAFLPDARLRLQMKRTGNMGAKGAYDPITGKTYLFTDNAESLADLLETAKGEILHRGTFVTAKDLANKYGGDVAAAFKEVNALHREVLAVKREAINAWLKENGYKELIDTPRGANEWLAHEAIKVAPKWYDRYVAAIAKFFRKVGKKLNHDFGLTEAEIRNFTRELLEAGTSGRETLQGQNASLMLQKTYQGSPTRGIVRMDDSYLGTGEGRRSETNNDYSGAYGWGHYSAQSKKTAEWYKSQLAKGAKVSIDGHEFDLNGELSFNSYVSKEHYPEAYNREVLKVAADIVYSTLDGGKDSAVAKAINRYNDAKSDKRWGNSDLFRDVYYAINNRYEDFQVTKNGQLYQLEVPDSDKLLDWDKPLSQQPAGVREKLWKVLEGNIEEEAYNFAEDNDDGEVTEQHIEWVKENIFGQLTGEDVYAALADGMGAKGASQYLDSMGIPGHQYLDGSSRSKGDGSRNIVTYSDKNIDITGTFYRKATPQATAMQPVPANVDTAEKLTNYLKDSGGGIIYAGKSWWAGQNDATFFGKMLRTAEYWKDKTLHELFSIMQNRTERKHALMHDFLDLPNDGSIHGLLTDLAKDKENYKLLEMGIDHADVNEVSQPEMEKWFAARGASPEMLETWRSIRASLDKQWDARIKPLKDLLAKGINPDVKVQVEEEVDGETKMVTKTWKLKQLVNEMGRMNGFYAPRMREEGDFVVKGTRGGERFRAHASNRVSAYKQRQQMIREGWQMEDISKIERLTDSMQQSLDVGSMAKVIESVAGKMNEKHSEVTSEFIGELLNSLADEIKGRGFRKAAIQRKGRNGDVTQGYIVDPADRFLRYTAGTAAGIAKMESSQAAIKTLFGTWKPAVKDANGNVTTPGEKIGGIDPKKEPQKYELGLGYIKEQMRNTESADRIVETAKSLATMKYLGFNPKAALVNVASMVTNVPAALHAYAMGGKGSMTSVFPVLAKAGKDYINVRARGQKLANADEQAFLDEMKKLDLDDPQYTRDASHLTKTASSKTWGTAMDWAMKMFSITERFNRGATMLAAYRLAREGGQSHAEATETAKHTSDRAHGVYGKATLPTWAQGTGAGARVGQAVYVYQKYLHNYLQLLHEMWGAKQYKAFAYATLAPTVLAGATGQMLPTVLIHTLGQAVLSAMGKGDDDPEKWVYDQIRAGLGGKAEEIARYGLFGAAGMNLSGSLGTIPSIPTDLSGLAGAAGGIVKDVSEAAGYVGTGELGKATEKLLPTGFAKPLQAIRESQSGVTTKTGQQVLDENGNAFKPGLGDSLLKGAGVLPARESVLKARTWDSKREETDFADKRSKIYQRIRGMSDKPMSDADKQKLADEITSFNEAAARTGNPNVSPITLKSVQNQQVKMAEAGNKERRRLQNPEPDEAELFTSAMVGEASHPFNVMKARYTRDKAIMREFEKAHDHVAAHRYKMEQMAAGNNLNRKENLIKTVDHIKTARRKVEENNRMDAAIKRKRLQVFDERIREAMDRAMTMVGQ